MSRKHSGLKIRKEDAKDILCGLIDIIDILRGFIFGLLILLSCSVIIRISKDVYMHNIIPKCTAQAEATVLHYEDLPDPWFDDDFYVVHNTRTLVETDLGNGLQEVELRGMQGKHKGDILILHYNPDNIEQFYTEVKQVAPDAPDEYLIAEITLLRLLSAMLLLSVLSVILSVIRTKNKEREKSESEKQSEGDE